MRLLVARFVAAEVNAAAPRILCLPSVYIHVCMCVSVLHCVLQCVLQCVRIPRVVDNENILGAKFEGRRVLSV